MKEFSPGQFEFLITGDIELSAEQYNSLMLPKSYPVVTREKDGWLYYQVGNDEFAYSWEPPGIQMTFNKNATFQKAKHIADEVVQNLQRAGFNADLLVIDDSQILQF